MNNEEKKRKIIESHEPSIISGSHVKRYGEVAIMKMMQAHTNQTLQELKEKVGGQQYDSDWGSEDAEYYRGYNDAIKEIIPIIEEAINE